MKSASTKKRKLDTRNKIELGGLVIKAGLDKYITNYIRSQPELLERYNQSFAPVHYNFDSFVMFNAKKPILGALVYITNMLKDDPSLIEKFDFLGDNAFK